MSDALLSKMDHLKLAYSTSNTIEVMLFVIFDK